MHSCGGMDDLEVSSISIGCLCLRLWMYPYLPLALASKVALLMQLFLVLEYPMKSSAKLWVQMVCNHSAITCNCLSVPSITLKFLLQRWQMTLWSPKLMATSQPLFSWHSLTIWCFHSLTTLSKKPFHAWAPMSLITGYLFNFTVYSQFDSIAGKDLHIS